MISDALKGQVASGALDPVDAHFGEMLSRLAPEASYQLIQVFAQLSHALSRQHSCLELADTENHESIINSLSQLSIVGAADEGGRPLVLDGTRLYMQRYFSYETAIATDLITRNQALTDIDVDSVSELTRSMFPSTDGTNWQQVAAYKALTRQLCIITGGPGTGKTTTVVKILEAILGLASDPPVIRLAAPTGKAAMRLNESIRELDLSPDFEVQTLHRLLGMRADGRSYRHGAQYPLNVDVLIVDEVSMIDLAMMHRLLCALPSRSRLILLGDPGQLPSVEAGNILADICRKPTGHARHRLAESICELQQSYRFSPDKGIGRLSRAIRENIDITLASDDEVEFHKLDEIAIERIAGIFESYATAIKHANDPFELLTEFEKARVLSPVHDGNFGVDAINKAIEATLSGQGVIDSTRAYYPGRPILITRNDYNLRLFNGDIGICIDDESNGEPLVIFRDSRGENRTYLASRLPPHETCFAMTIHKSQGSEFDTVMLMVPMPMTGPGEHLMTRELIYTAVTRAREHLFVYYEGDALTQSLANRTTRFSGLADRLLEV